MERRTFMKASCAAMAVGAGAMAQAAKANKRPNILFIMTDQQFADAMSCRMGREHIHTPAMDSLAERGMLFSRAYTPNPLCMPARQSIFTGRYPHETGVTSNSRVKRDIDEFISMGRYFEQAGYETVYTGKWHLSWSEKTREEHGFELLKKDKGLKEKDAITADSAARYLRERPHDKPFLAVVSFLGPHGVCQLGRGEKLPCRPIGDPPALNQCPPTPANLAHPIDESDSMTLMRKGYHASSTFPVGDFSPDKWREFRWGYYRIIEDVDRRIGEVLDALRETSLEKDTLVIFVSDHGDCAGAHRFNQKTVFYEESSRVPLIIAQPGVTAKGECDRLTNTGVDILPTMMAAAGVEQPRRLTGRSLLGLAKGKTESDWRDHVVIQNNMVQAGQVDGWKPEAQGRMVRSERFKYCLYQYGEQREELFDMEGDPLEKRCLATDAKYKSTLLEHRALLKAFAAKHNDALVGEMMADNIGPRPFPKRQSEPKRKKKA